MKNKGINLGICKCCNKNYYMDIIPSFIPSIHFYCNSEKNDSNFCIYKNKCINGFKNKTCIYYHINSIQTNIKRDKEYLKNAIIYLLKKNPIIHVYNDWTLSYIEYYNIFNQNNLNINYNYNEKENYYIFMNNKLKNKKFITLWIKWYIFTPFRIIYFYTNKIHSKWIKKITNNKG